MKASALSGTARGDAANTAAPCGNAHPIRDNKPISMLQERPFDAANQLATDLALVVGAQLDYEGQVTQFVYCFRRR